jgi:autotransporter-associated beta strand protein
MMRQLGMCRRWVGRMDFKAVPPLRALALCAMVAAVVYVGAAPAAAATYTWSSNNNGNWSDTSATGWNTSGGTNFYPSLAGDVANLSFNIATANKTVTIDVSGVTVGSLTLQDITTPDRSWILAASGGNNLTLNSGSTANATITSAGVNNAISAPLVLASNVLVTTTTALSMSGGISGTGGLIKAGASVLTLSNVSSYQGGTTINNGAVRVSGASQSLGNGSVTVLNNTELRLADILNLNMGGGATVTLAKETNLNKVL